MPTTKLNNNKPSCPRRTFAIESEFVASSAAWAMWIRGALLRFIRRRIVLAAIFCMSLTYFLVNFMQNGGPFETDDYEIRRTRPLVWRTADDVARLYANDSADATSPCRNSVQGRIWLVDDRGWVCLRTDVLTASGCCDPAAESSALHSCATCEPDAHCCSLYEQCVSCCLDPAQRPLLERVIALATGRQRAVFATVGDQFELCLAKCRTNSHSVQHENQYRRPQAKHCYGLTYAHESQREVAAGGGGIDAAAVAPEAEAEAIVAGGQPVVVRVEKKEAAAASSE